MYITVIMYTCTCTCIYMQLCVLVHLTSIEIFEKPILYPADKQTKQYLNPACTHTARGNNINTNSYEEYTTHELLGA